MNVEIPRIVVLMATYNGEPHIEDQVRSILDQRDVQVRLIIRDDGSTDETLNLVSAIAARNPGIVTVLDDGHGPCGSAAGNFLVLLRTCRVDAGEWIALADQDDVWFPDKLVAAIASMQACDADGYSSNLIAFSDDANAAWQVRKNAEQRPFDYLFQGASAGCTYVLSPRGLEIVRAGLARLTGDVPPHASHDWLIYALCRSAGLRWVLDGRARIAYRQHAGNVYGTQSGVAKLLERMRMLRSQWYRNAILWLQIALDASAEEREIFARVQRLSLTDRLWLARRVNVFRRDPRDARQLRVALLTGLFR